jgi:hypothetical protein
MEDRLEATISKALARPVRLQEFSLGWFTQLNLERLEILANADEAGFPVLRVSNVTAPITLRQLLTPRPRIEGTLRISELEANLVRKQNGALNVLEVMDALLQQGATNKDTPAPSRPDTETQALKIPLQISKFTIDNFNLRYVDQTQDQLLGFENGQLILEWPESQAPVEVKLSGEFRANQEKFPWDVEGRLENWIDPQGIITADSLKLALSTDDLNKPSELTGGGFALQLDLTESKQSLVHVYLPQTVGANIINGLGLGETLGFAGLVFDGKVRFSHSESFEHWRIQSNCRGSLFQKDADDQLEKIPGSDIELVSNCAWRSSSQALQDLSLHVHSEGLNILASADTFSLVNSNTCQQVQTDISLDLDRLFATHANAMTNAGITTLQGKATITTILQQDQQATIQTTGELLLSDFKFAFGQVSNIIDEAQTTARWSLNINPNNLAIELNQFSISNSLTQARAQGSYIDGRLDNVSMETTFQVDNIAATLSDLFPVDTHASGRIKTLLSINGALNQELSATLKIPQPEPILIDIPNSLTAEFPLDLDLDCRLHWRSNAWQHLAWTLSKLTLGEVAKVNSTGKIDFTANSMVDGELSAGISYTPLLDCLSPDFWERYNLDLSCQGSTQIKMNIAGSLMPGKTNNDTGMSIHLSGLATTDFEFIEGAVGENTFVTEGVLDTRKFDSKIKFNPEFMFEYNDESALSIAASEVFSIATIDGLSLQMQSNFLPLENPKLTIPSFAISEFQCAVSNPDDLLIGTDISGNIRMLHDPSKQDFVAQTEISIARMQYALFPDKLSDDVTLQFDLALGELDNIEITLNRFRIPNLGFSATGHIDMRDVGAVMFSDDPLNLKDLLQTITLDSVFETNIDLDRGTQQMDKTDGTGLVTLSLEANNIPGRFSEITTQLETRELCLDVSDLLQVAKLNGRWQAHKLYQQIDYLREPPQPPPGHFKSALVSLSLPPRQIAAKSNNFSFSGFQNDLRCDFSSIDFLGGPTKGTCVIALDNNTPTISTQLQITGADIGEIVPQIDDLNGPEAEINAIMYVVARFVPGSVADFIDNIHLRATSSRIGAKAFERLLLALDPEQKDPRVQKALAALSFGKPSRVYLEINNALITFGADLKSFAGITLTLPIINREPLGAFAQVYQLEQYAELIQATRAGLLILLANNDDNNSLTLDIP